jgi:hypothetical protein
VHGRVEEPLVETLHHSTDYHSGGTQTCCHRRYQHVENRADHHGTDEEPFGTEVFPKLSSADLRDNVSPKERRQDRVGVGPVGISLQDKNIKSCCSGAFGTYWNARIWWSLSSHGDNRNGQSDAMTIEYKKCEEHQDELEVSDSELF